VAEEATPAPSEALPSDEEAEEEAEEQELESEVDREDAAPRPSSPGFRFSTFLYTFLFLLGILMIFDSGTRYGVAEGVGYLLGPAIGFGGHYPLLTMFVAAAIEMILTAVAYNYTTDWLKTAKVQKWSSAFRKVQMAAMRSGKKDRIQALQVHQQTLTRLSMDVQFAQLKGMAITWFLVIAIYSWVYLFLAGSIAGGFSTPIHALCTTPVSPGTTCGSVTFPLGTSSVNLLGYLIGPIQAWFLIFSLYTIPLSLVFRRLLKHYSLSKHRDASAAPPLAPPQGRARGAA
jgi:uncharacterized membrane protein (DUF106 family)